MDTTLTIPSEKPANGIAGLKYWREDIVAGLIVSLISLPFSLGIAVASGAPPICGVISAIIAGLLLPFLGGSYVTISGPAAGLAPALLAGMTLLGKGNDPAHLAVGYPLLLGVICITGCVQLVLASCKAARFSAWFPAAVVEAMLASIGLLIIAKQIPHMLGYPLRSHDFWGMLAEAPSAARYLDPKVFGLGIFCLIFLFTLASIKARWARIIPPQLATVIVGLVIGQLIGLDSKFMISVPDKIFNGITMPNFAGLFGDQTIWLAIVATVLTLTLIDGVESLATASAIDRIDPYRRRSNPNRVLFAMGISNICSSMLGGLTIIPGGVKSKACIQAGGKTLWANFYNAIFLLIFLFFAKGLINMVPYSALAAMLIFTGWKLCEPKIWRHMAHVGRDQFFLFSLTVLVTLSTDLLWGIGFGVVAKLILNLVHGSIAVYQRDSRPATFGRWAASAATTLPALFRNPVEKTEQVGPDYHIYFHRPLVCFNCLHVQRALGNVPEDAETVHLHITENVTLLDHTTCDALFHFADDFERSGSGRVEIPGLDRMRGLSHHPAATRLGVASAAHAAATVPASMPVRAQAAEGVFSGAAQTH
jgi:MFS superfamily sulfate permease-like transporter